MPTKVVLRDAQPTQIPVAGRRSTPFAMEDVLKAKALFQMGYFSRDLLSVRKVSDSGVDAIMSKEHGCLLVMVKWKSGLVRTTRRLTLEQRQYFWSEYPSPS